MKHKLNGFLAFILVLITQITFAQDRTVSGVVTDKDGLPVPTANVKVKGTSNGVQTDFDGKYKIKAAADQTLVFSYLGMKTQEVKASSTVLNVKMQSDATELENVVVTAFGIKKQKRNLGYATATVSAKDLTDVNNTNVFESLSGKMAGVDISSPAQVGAAAKVVVRGFNSLTNSAGPLYIVDGTPITNTSSSGTTSTRSFDAGNGLSDIDPNNIESMTVLKGAAASALYGSRAAQGVFIITTKSGKNKSKVKVELNMSTDISQVARLPHLQNEFGQGWNGKGYSSWSGSTNTVSNENGSWGPAFNGQIRPWGTIVTNSSGFATQQIKPYIALENNIKDFFEQGSTFSNSVRISGGGDNANYSLNFSDVNSDGIIPSGADSFNRKTLGISGGVDGEKLKVKSNFNYVRKSQAAVNTGQGADAGEGNTLTQELLQIPRDISVVDLEDYTNNPFNTNSNYFSPYTSNPYWSVYENSTKIDANRFYGNVNLNYVFNNKFSISYQAGGDYRSEKVKSYGAIVKYEPGSPQALGGVNPVVGGVTEQIRDDIEFDTNLMLNYNSKLTEDISLSGLIGFNSNQRSLAFLRARITNLDIPNFYEISNSSVKPVVAQTDSFRKSFGAFASLETSYKNKLFITFTGRNDWTSTLPVNSNSYFYPSLNISGILLDNSNHYAKLRLGYAEVGGDTLPYQTESALIQGNAGLGFGNITLPIGGVNGYEFDGNLGNNKLVPERTKEYEIGFESNLFNKRVNLDLAVYTKTTTDLLFRRPLATSTGFSTQTDNILDLNNKGIEVVLNLVPIKSNNFQWDFTTTFTKNVSEVLSIKDDVTKLLLASNYGVSYNAVKGEPLGTFMSFVPKTNSAGQYIVDPTTGYYVATTDEQKIGTSERDFVMGFKNKFTYKNLILSFGIDWKQGGQLYSYTKRLSHFTGNGIETAYNSRNPFIIPNSVVEVVNGSGVVTGYNENTTAITFENITDFYNPGNNPGIEQNHIIDKTFVRLRDISLAFNVPASIVKKMGLVNATISVYGKNLALWTPKDNPYVDPELSTYGSGLLSEQGEFGTNPSQHAFGANLKLTF